jgi:hypothetical protein
MTRSWVSATPTALARILAKSRVLEDMKNKELYKHRINQ